MLRLTTHTDLPSGDTEIQDYEVWAHAVAPSRLTATGPNDASSGIWPFEPLTKSRRRAAGTPRCRHFLSVSGLTPIARATSATTSQSTVLIMPSIDRDHRSRCQGTDGADIHYGVVGTICPMPQKLPDSILQKRKKLCARTKQLRRASGLSGPTVAEKLGVEYERYKKWERRNPMPAEYIDDFCFIVGGDPTYLTTAVAAVDRQPRKKQT